MTASAARIVEPMLMISATDLPSRISSRISDVISATASGWLSCRPRERRFRPFAVYDRERLAPGMRFTGPALVEEASATSVIDVDADVDAIGRVSLAIPPDVHNGPAEVAQLFSGAGAVWAGSTYRRRMVLKPGDKAPSFSLLDQNNDKVTLASLRGRKALIYFYPKADTPGCTAQACGLRDIPAAGAAALPSTPK